MSFSSLLISRLFDVRQFSRPRQLFFKPALVCVLSFIFSPIALAQEQGDLMFRLGAMNFEPSVSSSPVQTPSSGLLAGSGVGFDGNSQVGLSLTYMLSNAIALEAMITAPLKHDLTISGLDQYGLSTTNLGDVKQLPPSFSALYYFRTPAHRLRPYIGAGFTYTKFFDDSLSTQARTELGAEGLE